MKPLNALQYIKNNFKSVLPIFVSLTIGVVLIYVFSLFSATTTKMVSVASFDIMEKYNIVYTQNDTTLPNLFLEELENNQETSFFAVQMNLSGSAYYRGGMGGTQMMTFNVFEEDTLTLLDGLDMELIDGTLPKNNQYEIIVPIDYALQNNLSVGDYVGTEISDKYSIQGKYFICGLIEGETVFAVSCQPGSETKEEVMRRGVMYRVDRLNAVTQKRLNDSLPDNVIALTHDYYKQDYEITLSSMKALTYILTAVMIIILCIALGNLNIVLYSNRRNELTILNYIGFTKGRISKKLWIENLILCMGGYLAGVALTMVGVWLYNILLLIPEGKVLEVIDLQGLIAAFTMPAVISVFSLLPSLISNSNQAKII